MADAFTPNRNLIQPQVGGDDGTWGGLLNLGVMAQLDTILGNTQAISITGANVTLTINQWNNAAIRLSGVLTGDRSLIVPFIDGSTTVAVGGLFVVDNQTTGAFNVTVVTQVSGSTGVVVPQGLRTYLFSDGNNVWYADDSKLQLRTNAGNPNGALAGVAASVNNPPSVCWDYTNLILYICTTTGDASTAVWTNAAATSATLTFPQGRLTPVNNTPVVTGDVTAASVIYYTPYTGALTPIHNGTVFVPYQFTQLQLTLTSSQAANSIYDVFIIYNSGSPVIGVGPSWTNATAGSCTRGTGAGTTQISRNSFGFLVNAVSINITYNTGSGNNTVVVGSGQALYLGSIWIDSSAGKVTCNYSFGQSRKFGVWNYYNRVPIILMGGDNTASWTYNSLTVRAANGNSANNVSVFAGVAEEAFDATYSTNYPGSSSTGAVTFGGIGLGINSTTAFAGRYTQTEFISSTFKGLPLLASYTSPPLLGINTIYCLEAATSVPSLTCTFQGTQTFMKLVVIYNG